MTKVTKETNNVEKEYQKSTGTIPKPNKSTKKMKNIRKKPEQVLENLISSPNIPDMRATRSTSTVKKGYCDVW